MLTRRAQKNSKVNAIRERQAFHYKQQRVGDWQHASINLFVLFKSIIFFLR
jgi:hypothetical protein